MQNQQNDREMNMPLELTDQQLEKVDGGMQAENLQFTEKTAKSASTVQKGAAPKEGSLVHKEANPTDNTKTIEDKNGIEGLFSGGGEHLR